MVTKITKSLKVFACLVVVCGLLMTSACSSTTQKTSGFPEFKFEDFFQGKLIAKGVVVDRKGLPISSFTADLVGTWKDNQGTLEEVFYFNDNKIEYRTWTIVLDKSGNREFSATANDVKGRGTGVFLGNTARMDYKLIVPYKSDTLVLSVKDDMFLIDENTLLAESTLRKFGFRVGKILLSITKVDSQTSPRTK